MRDEGAKRGLKAVWSAVRAENERMTKFVKFVRPVLTGFGLDVLMMGGYLEEFHTSINAETGHHVWKMVFVDQNLATARASAGATGEVVGKDS
jgi:hypothetical protein